MANDPMTERGRATRERILTAATAEFAAYGVAGARVDRIAASATTNKAQLYSYFGSKTALFEAVFEASLQHMLEVVPISAEDLADWAVRLYDEYLERPDLVRLATWARLECRPEGHLLPGADRVDAGKLSSIADAQKAGAVVSGVEPFDVMAMVITMSMAWSPVSNVFTASKAEPRGIHDSRRAFLRHAVMRAVSPGKPTEATP